MEQKETLKKQNEKIEKSGDQGYQFIDVKEEYCLEHISDILKQQKISKGFFVKPDSNGERVLKNCQSQSFLIGDNHYIVTTGIEQAKVENSQLRSKSVLNIHKFNKENKQIDQIFQVNLNNTALAQFTKQAKCFVVFHAHLYYYTIKNMKTEVEFNLCKYSFEDEENIVINTQKEKVDSPICFVAFAEQDIKNFKTQLTQDDPLKNLKNLAQNPRTSLNDLSVSQTENTQKLIAPQTPAANAINSLRNSVIIPSTPQGRQLFKKKESILMNVKKRLIQNTGNHQLVLESRKNQKNLQQAHDESSFLKKQFIVVGQFTNKIFGIKFTMRQISNFEDQLAEFTPPDFKKKGIKVGLYFQQIKQSEIQKEENLLILQVQVDQEKLSRTWDIKHNDKDQNIYLIQDDFKLKYSSEIEDKLKKANFKPYHIFNTFFDEDQEEFILAQKNIQEAYQFRFCKELFLKLNIIQGKSDQKKSQRPSISSMNEEHHNETLDCMLEVQTFNIIRDRNMGQMLLFIVKDRDDNNPQQIEFFYGIDDQYNLDIPNPTLYYNGLNVPHKGGQCIEGFKNLFIWKNWFNDSYKLIYIKKDKSQLELEDKEQKIIKKLEMIIDYKVFNIDDGQKVMCRQTHLPCDIQGIRPLLNRIPGKGIFLQLVDLTKDIDEQIDRDTKQKHWWEQLIIEELNGQRMEQVALTQSSMVYTYQENNQSIDLLNIFTQNYQCQNFQVSCLAEDKTFIKIFEYRVMKANTTKESKLILLGIKLILNDKKYRQNELFFEPLINESGQIIGTQLKFQENLFHFNILKMANIPITDFKFKGDVVSTTKKKYFTQERKKSHQGPNFLLIEARLCEKIVKIEKSFSKEELFQILNDAIKFNLNMIPYRLFDVLKDQNDFGLFENLEVLDGQTKCDYSIANASTLKKMIKNEKEAEYNETVFQEFMHSVFPLEFRISQLQSLEQHDLIQLKDRPYKDIYLSNPLEKCFQFKKINPASADILVDYCLSLNRSRTLNGIILDCMKYFLKDNFEHRQFSNFFINSELENYNSYDDNDDEKVVGCCFSHWVRRDDLPHFGTGEEYLEKIDFDENRQSDMYINENYCKRDTFVMDKLVKQASVDKSTEGKTVPIYYLIIDLRSVRTYKKISDFRKNILKIRDKKMSDVDVSKLMLLINQKYPNDIDKHFGVRNIIDQQFELKTLNYFIFQMLLYVFGFVIPISLQMFTFVEDEIAIDICMFLCLTSQSINIICEILKMRSLGYEYFWEFYHYIEVAHFSIFVVYFWLRMNFHCSMLPEDYVIYHEQTQIHSINDIKMHEDNATYWILTYFSVFNCFLYASVGLKCMSYMRIHPKLGQLELLIGKCMYDCVPFAVFYCAWTYLFARFNEILGVNSEISQFTDVKKVFRYFFQVYENSVGQVQNPNYSFWSLDMSEDSQSEKQFMIGLIWFVWFCQQWFIFMILLNFVIALISQSYDSVMTQYMEITYRQRTYLNRECRIIAKSLGYKVRMDNFLLKANPEHQFTQDGEWQGFVQTIKNFIQDQNQKLSASIHYSIKHELALNFNNMQNMQNKKFEVKIDELKDSVEDEINLIDSKIKQQDKTIDELQDNLEQIIENLIQN